MRIPKQFCLFGHLIMVEFDQDKCDDLDALGLADNDNNLISLARKKDGERLPKEMIEYTFVHEMMHHLLWKVGENKLGNDEKFVSKLAGALHQALTTAK